MKNIAIFHTGHVWKSLYNPSIIDVEKIRKNLIISIACYLNSKGIRLVLLDDYANPFLDKLFPKSSIYLDDYFKFMDKFQDKKVEVKNYIELMKKNFPDSFSDKDQKYKSLPDLQLFNVASDENFITDLYILKFKPLDGRTRELITFDPWNFSDESFVGGSNER
jgi:hypothetical protein